MTEVGLNHCQIVGKSLAGERPVDEQSFASLAILMERLEGVKKRGKVFSQIEFSPDVNKLKRRENAVPVG